MNSMRNLAHVLLLTGFVAAGIASAADDQPRILSFVFGPASQEAAKQSARAAAATTHHWLQTAGSDVEVRRAGSPDVQQVSAQSSPKDLDQMFGEIATAARDSDPASFLISLDGAAQAAAQHPGVRVVVASLNSPPFSSDGEQTLKNLIEFCRDKSVRVLIFDVERTSKAAPSPALDNLAIKTGGLWVRQAHGLEGDVAAMSTTIGELADNPTPAKAESTEAAKAAPATEKAGSSVIPPFVIPVHARFMRTAGTGSTSESIMDHESDFGETFTLTQTVGVGGSTAALGGGGSMENSYEPNDANAPLQGLVTVEAPLNGLKFDLDDTAGTYHGHARITATVKNAKGVVIWTGKRDINIHGPIARLDARRQGSIYFMRGTTLIGPKPFTLEAKVEDLIAGTSGVTQVQLKVGRNAPGLVASDALVVRPFKGSADKFESDQVLSYDGEALSPVLNPVFRADEPINLQIYLRLYPDIHGDLPALSMEVRRGTQVVARMPLPYKGELSNSAREGAASSIQGRANNILGGQAKEFPYLADLKGARFPPGDYTGIISIRQGNHAIARIIPFTVTGSGDTPQSQAAIGGKTELVDRTEPELENIVLPEVVPASIDSSGLKMPEEEQKRLWEEAAKVALGYLDKLPNFRCTQETHRFIGPAKAPDQLHEADTYKDEVMHEDGRDKYRTIEINGVKGDAQPSVTQSVQFHNEFGSMLRGLFDPETGAKYQWAGRAMAMGVLCQVFDVQVAMVKSNFVLNSGSRRERVPYSGRVFIDEETGMVRRLTIQGGPLPKDFALQSPAFSLDYGMVRIGADDYLLPLRSVIQLRRVKTFVRNENVFSNYRKFAAESDIKFNN